MPVITITVTDSPIQIVAGIPLNVTLTTNIPATIFYTLDGTNPTFDSDIAIGPIQLPTQNPSVELKTFASNGTDTSTVVSILYSPSWAGDRRPRDQVISSDAGCGPCGTTPKPFTIASPDPNAVYGNTAGVTVDAPGIVGIPDQFDGKGTGTYADETDLPYHRWNYDIVYSESNSLGQTGHGIGNLPATVKVYNPVKLNNSNNANSDLFNPRAMVVVQDGREPPQDPNTPMINRQFFSLGNPERIRDGIGFNTTGFEGSATTGSFLKAHYNPTEDTYTYYYRDSETNRWIISIEPASKAKSNHASNMGNYLLPPTSFAEKKVFRWIPFKRQILR